MFSTSNNKANVLPTISLIEDIDISIAKYDYAVALDKCNKALTEICRKQVGNAILDVAVVNAKVQLIQTMATLNIKLTPNVDKQPTVGLML